MTAPGDITALLRELGEGQPAAYDRLMDLVYDELRHLAHRRRFEWGGAPAPGTTSLVHEVYLKLVEASRLRLENRAQFFHLASRAMRSILIDNARWHSRRKRDGKQVDVPVDELPLVSEERSDELIALDEALTNLEATDSRLGKVVECRFFGGLTIEETATALDLSPATVKRDWSLARAWLYRELREDG